jgi:NAD(P)H dehydrogenase (quinone)
MSKVTSASVRSRIAIAGATGRVGSALTELLAADQVDVVALTRQPDKAQAPRGVTVAAIDFGAPETLREALRGADRLFISEGSSPQQVANERALIDAAVAAGVRHIVKVSAMGPATRLYPFAWHMEIEAHLARQMVASTVLRPSAYADVLIRRAAGSVGKGSWSGAAGDGRINFIDVRDIAKVARVALSEGNPSGLPASLPSDRTEGVDDVAGLGRAVATAWPSRRLHKSDAR